MNTGTRLKFISTFLSLLMLAACTDNGSHSESEQQKKEVTLPEGISFIEEIGADPEKTIIPYQKYKLNNGLTLILHEDHSDPLVHIDITYHVGSGREEKGKSGFAHFFEHMMFQGSEHVADEEHFKLITEAGGTMNGTTSTDRTNYYQTVPANQLEKILWLESDRMGFLLNAITQKKFEVQRETVKNERGQNYDNRPYGLLYEKVNAALYPDGHPYSWPTIGFLDDLNRVDVNDLKRFFLRWYGPNNATLTIGGDIDVAATIDLVNKYFASIPIGPEVKLPEKPQVHLSEDRYISFEDNVHLPLIYMSYPTVSGRHPDEAPLDILSEILGGSKTSLLYKNLVKNQFAVQAQVSHPCTELACTFNLLALPHPASGKSLSDLEMIIRNSIAEFEDRGVEEDDLTKVKAKMEAAFIFGLQSVHGKVAQLASNETYTGNPNFIEDDIARYNNVTKADVTRVFNKYIKGSHGVILSIVPHGKLNTIAHKDTFEPPIRSFDVVTKIDEDELVTRIPEDNFDRNIQPSAGTIAPAALPEYWKHTMKNGITILGSRSTETPTTSILIKVPGGHYAEATDKAGTASLLAALLSESTSQRSTEEMSNELQKIGANVHISAQNLYLSIIVSSLSKNIDAAIALAKEKVFQPGFLTEDYDRLRNQSLQGILNNKKNASYLASRAYGNLLFGDNIAGLPRGGTEATIKNVDKNDLISFYGQHFKPLGTQIIIVSNLPKEALIASLDKTFGEWQGEGPDLDLKLDIPSHKKNTIYLVDKKDAPQSEIRIGKRGIKEDVTGEFYRTGLTNFPLGGHFNSRINLNLREDKGYTYGAFTGFSASKLSGHFTASASVKADTTDLSIAEFVKEIGRYHDEGITKDELAFLKKAINQRDALKYETPSAKLGFLAKILEHDLSPDFVKQRIKIVEDLTKAEIDDLAKKHLNLDDMFMVVVGDTKQLKPKLKAMGYNIEDFAVE
ncbi:MAG: zinc protease [Candidatus Azotimanducaceae bacterium]|jgi:zinc protease